MQHVNAQEILRLLVRRQVFRRRFQVLTGHAAVLVQVAVGHALGALLGELSLHQIVGVLAQLGKVLRLNQTWHDEEPVAPKCDVLLHRHVVTIATRIRFYDSLSLLMHCGCASVRVYPS